MNLYTAMTEHEVDDQFMQYIQLGNGPMISVRDPKALEMFKLNEKAYDLYAKKRFYKAIRKFNKSDD